MIRRRIAMLGLVIAGFAGMALVPLAAPADAAVTHLPSDAPGSLLNLCIIVQAADAGLCLHI